MKWNRTRGLCSGNSCTSRGLVSREIVEDDVSLLIGRPRGYDFLEEDGKVAAGVACAGRSVNAAGRDVLRRIQRQGSVPVVFESVALGAARRKQHTGSRRSSA